jgi:predicted RNA binding protein with dsRBD fold (UPF0201 family)
MEVSPQAKAFSEIYPTEDTEGMKEQFQKLVEEEKIVAARDGEPLKIATVVGSEQALRALQDDLRKAEYRKLR